MVAQNLSGKLIETAVVLFASLLFSLRARVLSSFKAGFFFALADQLDFKPEDNRQMRRMRAPLYLFHFYRHLSFYSPFPALNGVIRV